MALGPELKRSTVYLDPDLHRAVKLQALETSSSISELINQAVGLALLEDKSDLADCEERSIEPTLSFWEMLNRLELNGAV